MRAARARCRGRKAWRPSSGCTPDGYRLSEAQAQRILEMRLQRLTALEQDKIVAEYREMMDKIVGPPRHPVESCAHHAHHQRRARRDEEQYGDERRSEIVDARPRTLGRRT